MPLSWNEIKTRATAFSVQWKNTAREEAEAQSFLIDFLNIFGISRKRFAHFEQKVRRLDGSHGYIDLLWKGYLLVEMKSRGQNLEAAYQQAKDYCAALKEHELPKLILVCDFEHFHLYHFSGTAQRFTLDKLTANIHHLALLAGYQERIIGDQDPVNVLAAERMGLLHDKLKLVGYNGHALEVYLVRLLFCLFADDTGIFEQGSFQQFIEERTAEDGSDLAARLAHLFQVLDQPANRRPTNLDEQLAAFPYVNGLLFRETLPIASFDSQMRALLLKCCALNWAQISPAIFGSMFQSVMNPTERRNLGAHYTSEKNILKVIGPLFLDELKAEFERVKASKPRLQQFHQKISNLRFLDPACGCGNFLIIAYRELRLLEIEIIKVLLLVHGKLRAEVAASAGVDIAQLVKCDVDMFYGIEYEEFPAQIAQVAMWLIDHQMNLKVSETFGNYYVRLPLRKSAHIAHANALTTEWQSMIEPMPWDGENPGYDYIMGNPPFIGSKLMTDAQRKEVVAVFNNAAGCGTLDYVAAWYGLAGRYLQSHPRCRAAFVSTNSVVQGEQVAALWRPLLEGMGLHISFAHQTFKWSNEARGVAAVYCIIVGFSRDALKLRRLFSYPTVKAEPIEQMVDHINAYLVAGPHVLVATRQKPLAPVPALSFGNMPLDGGHLLLSEEERLALLAEEPGAQKFIRPLISAKEFLNNQTRWCLWLVQASPAELRALPLVMERVKKVKEFRLASVAPSTQKFAATPTLFRDRQTPDSFIVIPRVSSERRQFIPMGFFGGDSVASDTCMFLPNGNLYHFGVLMSTMHMTWVKYVCGRLKSDYRYSKDIVYNNFPWPVKPTAKQMQAVEQASQAVLAARAQYPGDSLADMYDAEAMPLPLVQAHKALDKAVDAAYKSPALGTEQKRIVFLFGLYEEYVKGMFGKAG